MAFIPKGARWYVADIVIEIVEEGTSDCGCWINSHLIKAKSPKRALKKARRIGKQQNSWFVNWFGKRVDHRFLGVSELQVVLDRRLRSGVEIGWYEDFNVDPEYVRSLMPKRKELAVFQPMAGPAGPRYVPKGMWEAELKAAPRKELDGKRK